MLNHILSFFSDLILITGGIVVCLIWIALFIALGIEIWDAFHDNNEEDEEEDYYQ